MNRPPSINVISPDKTNIKNNEIAPLWNRRRWMLLLFIIVIATLLGRAIYLQIMLTEFLKNQGDARYLRTIPIVAHRGMILDQQGEPLAISTPVDSVWVNPKQFNLHQAKQLARLLEMSVTTVQNLINERKQKEFVYIKRHITPQLAEQIKALELTGVFLQREYHRYYPAAGVTGHILGFTDIDDKGLEGLELAYEQQLMGISGAKQVIQDKYGHTITEVKSLQVPQDGQDIYITIDKRLQYLAYRELNKAVQLNRARSGTVVILDVQTGAILAMVNQPAYNPNNREKVDSEHYRNRAVTDVFEPGSTLKPFTMIAALSSGKYTIHSLVDTNPGSLQLNQYTVHDSRNYGVIDLPTIIQKSSNVGASKIALSLPKQQLWEILFQVGFGQLVHSGLPGEVIGHLNHYSDWYHAEHATLSFGYGISVTALQLAQAYATLGNGGIRPTVHIIQQTMTTTDSRVFSIEVAKQVISMLETVVQPGGTGAKAQVLGYRVAGKTGTVRKTSVQGGYTESDYLALFAGLIPASKPRLAMVVIIDTPRGESYYGGDVAAPVFGQVMADAVRLLNIPPDG